MTRILIAEDEDRIVSFLEKGLRAGGYTHRGRRAHGHDALALARDDSFDLLLLDLGLPGLDGHEVLRALRARGETMPVVILTARDGVDDTVAGLRGRRRRLRHQAVPVRGAAGPDPAAPARWCGPRVDGARGRRPDASTCARGGPVAVRCGDRVVELTAREFALAEVFLRHAGQVLSREQLLSHVWGYDFDPGLERRRRVRALPAPQARRADHRDRARDGLPAAQLSAA